jgi:hypothetical protein
MVFRRVLASAVIFRTTKNIKRRITGAGIVLSLVSPVIRQPANVQPARHTFLVPPTPPLYHSQTPKARAVTLEKTVTKLITASAKSAQLKIAGKIKLLVTSAAIGQRSMDFRRKIKTLVPILIPHLHDPANN